MGLGAGLGTTGAGLADGDADGSVEGLGAVDGDGEGDAGASDGVSPVGLSVPGAELPAVNV